MTVFPTVASPREWESVRTDPAAKQQILTLVANAIDLDPSLFHDTRHGTNLIFQTTKREILKIFPPVLRDQYDPEIAVLPFLEERLTVETPRVLLNGETEGWSYILMTKLEGENMEEVLTQLTHDEKRVLLFEIGCLMKEVHLHPVGDLALESRSRSREELSAIAIERHRTTELPDHLQLQLPNYLSASRELLAGEGSNVLLTGEYTPFNLMIKRDKTSIELSGMFDFGDSWLGPGHYDLIGPSVFLAAGDLVLMESLFSGYGLRYREIEHLRPQLLALLVTHRYANFKDQLRLPGWDRAESFEILSRMIWPSLP